MIAVAVRLVGVLLFVSVQRFLFVDCFLVFPVRCYSSRTLFATQDDNDDIQNLYKSVAQQDPQWFRSFVVDVLGEDTVDSDLLNLLESVDDERGDRTRANKVMGSRHELELDVAPSDASSDDTRRFTKESSSGKMKKKGVVLEDDDILSDCEAKTRTIDAALDDFEPAVPAVLEDSSQSIGSQTTAASLSDKKKDNSSTTDASTFVVDTGSAELISQTVDSMTLEEEKVKEIEKSPSATDADAQNSSDESFESPKVSLPDTLPTGQGIETSSILTSTLEINQQNDTPSSTTAVSDVSTDPDSAVQQELYVQYQLQNDERKKSILLSQFVSLGFTRDEILELDADVLDMIASESITRPKRGIPDRWKTCDSTSVIVDAAEIAKVSRKESTTSPSAECLETTTSTDGELPAKSFSRARERAYEAKEPVTNVLSKERESEGSRSMRRDAMESEPTVSPRRGQKQEHQKPVDRENEASMKSRRRSQDNRPADAPRRRRRRTSTSSDKKPVYSPRPTHRGRRRSLLDGDRRQEDDPPTKYWMGLDTFRGLLRMEYKLREIISFGQLEGPLLDEAEWRLNLYRGWLWTLHTGVGEPVVLSRKERAQREQDRMKRDRRMEDLERN